MGGVPVAHDRMNMLIQKRDEISSIKNGMARERFKSSPWHLTAALSLLDKEAMIHHDLSLTTSGSRAAPPSAADI